MSSRLHAYLDLVRIPNVLTAAADVLAGYLYAGGDLRQATVWLPLVLGSMGLYSGGIALNDVCDADEDARDRPSRPIPSGRIPRTHALKLSIGLLAVGWILAGLASWTSLLAASALVAAIVSYNAALKPTLFGPPNMGLCRALNMSLGLGAGLPLNIMEGLAPAIVMGLYITSVTYFARDEAGVPKRSQLLLATGGIGLAAMAVGLLPQFKETPGEVHFAVAAMFAGGLVFTGLRAMRRGSPRAVQRAVRVYVLSVILLDAEIASAPGSTLSAFLIAGLLVPTVLLARAFRVT